MKKLIITVLVVWMTTPECAFAQKVSQKTIEVSLDPIESLSGYSVIVFYGPYAKKVEYLFASNQAKITNLLGSVESLSTAIISLQAQNKELEKKIESLVLKRKTEDLLTMQSFESDLYAMGPPPPPEIVFKK